ncbi:alpha-amylase family glycosyl hydrolase [Acanthopleuribacter pedis]|uniref:DUF3459 domain-containing protein n=1 Tax=Acanthopleuribacter pedis TaxID=442870 RepID=A0A8J7Q1V3_9BACT|nr:alpha-amylase family glycosyl hydrolase [Acanthopleuribacter pedis]MBO1318922.1 DUF3459 domain-containing protein [Acanthopleuribacter pedis]
MTCTCDLGEDSGLNRNVVSPHPTFPAVIRAVFLITLLISGFAFALEPKERGADDWADEVLYFVVLDRFADGDPRNNRDVDIKAKGTFHGGDLLGLTQRLDDLQDLGVTAVWLTPVVKNIDHYVDGVGFPDWGYHGYWADDFHKIDDRFGTEAELKTLVDEAHKRGIKILLDVVYNHAGYGAAYLKQDHANEWFRTGRRQSPCGDDPITQCLSGLPDFKTDNDEVVEYLFKAHLGLAKRVGLDGFRLDTVKHVEHEFWQKHRARADKELGPSFFLLGEVWGGDYKVLDPYFENDEMDAGFDFSFAGNVLGFVNGRGRTIAFSRYLLKRHRVRDGFHLAHYLSSHDVPGFLYQLKGDKTKFKLAAALKFTSAGIPTIYYGEEVGRLGGDWPDNRSDMPWGDRPIPPGKGLPRDEAMYAYYRKLIQIRKQHPVLALGDYQELHTDGELLVFARHAAAGKTVIVAVNRGAEPLEVTVPFPKGLSEGPLKDLLGDAPVASSAAGVQLVVGGQAVQIIARP